MSEIVMSFEQALKGLIGRACVVRSDLSGVWGGTITTIDPRGVTMHNARRAYEWQGPQTCSELALFGPTGGRICAPVPVTALIGLIEVIPMSDEAIARWRECPVWQKDV